MAEVAKLDTRKLDAISASLGVNTDQALASIALQVEGEAKTRAPRDPKRPPMDPSQPTTGALRSSIKTTKKRRGLYWVHDGVEYGIYQEFGTYKMRARPFMVPAVEAVRRYIDKMFEGLFK